MAYAVATAAASDLLIAAVKLRLLEGATQTAPEIMATDECALPVDSNPKSPKEFRDRYPNGLAIVCDESVHGHAATAQVQVYLFNASRNEVLMARKIDVGLVSRGGKWSVGKWRPTSFDYAPVLP